MNVIGLDIGGTTTKAVLLSGDKVKHSVSATGSEPLVSASGALGKLIEEAKIPLSEIKLISCTGGGARHMGCSLLGLKTVKVDEIESIGHGGLFLSGLDEAVVASIGTGTAVVHAKRHGNEVISRHLGGTGVGGGTLVGLGRLLLGRGSVEGIVELAERGRHEAVDLLIRDIVGGPVGNLPESATASNFGKVGDGTELSDIAAGLVRMISEVVGTVICLAAKSVKMEDRIVLVGTVPTIRIVGDQIKETIAMLGGHAVVPDKASYAAAVGAAMRAR
ncbi:pantothenate kinase [Candidatus Methanodesulfokora washburnensis]|jgi:type II pantothenate kinase|uniref:Pantothenate kinase n=1 Tax=Candidatus Methanodesulfokora washburnensis TaxID=2478471 RepID=A0A429GIX3_9CREN|nr:pantothenate kinase [Candidatus Methanodesulfokores washburnensis]RSN73862.1 pantothenate kinase [Candidatus Methanodesulfokores washburnensis]